MTIELTPVVERDANVRAGSDSTDRARCEALARTMGPRLHLCTDEELRLVDVLLESFEHERDGSTAPGAAIERLRRDRYNVEDGGNAIEIAQRRGWTSAMRHVEVIARIDRGLAELRNAGATLDARMLASGRRVIRDGDQQTAERDLVHGPAVSRTRAMDFDHSDEESR